MILLAEVGPPYWETNPIGFLFNAFLGFCILAWISWRVVKSFRK